MTFLRSLNQLKTDLTRRVRGAVELSWGVTCETGASLLTYELFPLGVGGRTLPRVPALSAIQPGERLPILFIHGVFHNTAAFAWLSQRLAWAGWNHFFDMNLFPSVHSVKKMAEQTRHQVERLLKKYSCPQIDIIAHSMGGIVARYFVQLLDGDGLVRHLVTLGTPHQGTSLTQYAVLSPLRELMPTSHTVMTLNRCRPPRITQGLAISGSLDFLLRPLGSGHWKGVRNIELKHVGHAGLLFSRRVFHIIASRLTWSPRSLAPTG